MLGEIEAAGQRPFCDFDQVRIFVFPFDHRAGEGLAAGNEINIGIKDAPDCLDLGQRL